MTPKQNNSNNLKISVKEDKYNDGANANNNKIRNSLFNY